MVRNYDKHGFFFLHHGYGMQRSSGEIHAFVSLKIDFFFVLTRLVFELLPLDQEKAIRDFSAHSWYLSTQQCSARTVLFVTLFAL